MKMYVEGIPAEVQKRTSKKGNEYTVVKIVDTTDYSFLTVMVDKDVDSNVIEEIKSYGKTNVMFILDYNARFKNFVIKGYKK